MPEKPIKGQDQDEVLTRLEDFWTSAMSDASQREWREKIAIPCFNYKEGKQWTDSELAELEKRKQPPVVNNQVKVTIDRIVGQYVKEKTRIAFRGRNTPDEATGDALTNLFRFIAQNNDLEFEEKDMFEDGVTAGFGVLDVSIEYDEMFEPEIKVQHEDALQCFYDPKARRYDWNKDALFVGRWKWVDIDEAKETFPDKAAELARAVDGDAADADAATIDSLQNFNIWYDKERKRIRIIEIQYKTKRREKIYVIQGKGIYSEAQLSSNAIEEARKLNKIQRETYRMAETINIGIFTGHTLLEHKETERRYFSLVPFFVQRKKNGAPYSLIYSALPLQDAINKRESKALHLLNVNQQIFERGAIGDKTALADNAAKPDGQIEIEDGFFDKFKLEKNLDLAVTQMNFHESSQKDFRRVTGVNPDAMGEKSEIRSGVGIAKKIAQTELIIAPIFDSLRRTRAILARNVLDLIQLYYDAKKVFTITDDLNAAKPVVIGADTFARIKQSKYDIVIDEIPDLATSREEQFNSLGDILPRILPFGPFWVRILLQASNIPEKAELLKQLQSIPPPPNEPKISATAQIEQLTAPERAFLYQKMGAPPELVQMVAQLAPPPKSMLEMEKAAQDNAQKGASDQVKAQSDQMKAQGDQVKLQSQLVKGQADQIKAQLDIEKAKIDVQKEIIKLQAATEGASEANAGE